MKRMEEDGIPRKMEKLFASASRPQKRWAANIARCKEEFSGSR